MILTILEFISKQILACDDMFSVLQQVKIAMSNKNDPYNYAYDHVSEMINSTQTSLFQLIILYHSIGITSKEKVLAYLLA